MPIVRFDPINGDLLLDLPPAQRGLQDALAAALAEAGGDAAWDEAGLARLNRLAEEWLREHRG